MKPVSTEQVTVSIDSRKWTRRLATLAFVLLACFDGWTMCLNWLLSIWPVLLIAIGGWNLKSRITHRKFQLIMAGLLLGIPATQVRDFTVFTAKANTKLGQAKSVKPALQSGLCAKPSLRGSAHRYSSISPAVCSNLKRVSAHTDRFKSLLPDTGAGAYATADTTGAHAMLGTVTFNDVQLAVAIPDTGSNYNIFSHVSYLWKVDHQVNLAVDGIADAKATHVGSARISQLGSELEVVTTDLMHNSLVVPSCSEVLLGNKNEDLKFDSWNSQMIRLNGGDRTAISNVMPVKDESGTYSIPTYVHRRGVYHNPTQIRNALLMAANLTDEFSEEEVVVDERYEDTFEPQNTNLYPGRKGLVVADLCCGIGAATHIAISGGHTIVAAADINPHVMQQYEHSHGHTTIWGCYQRNSKDRKWFVAAVAPRD